MSEENDKLDPESTPSTPSKGNGRDEDEIHIEILDPEEGSSLALEPPAETSQEILDLEKQLEDLRREKEDIYDRLLRKHAEFDNYRKRAEKDKQDFRKYALADFMGELIPILDNFERALSHSDDQSGPEYRKGIELIHRQLRDLMEKRGVTQIQAEGQPFDPNYHEAIVREQRNDLPENTILQELQKGYLFHSKLLRPAIVKVSFRSPEEIVSPDEGGEPEPAATETASEDGWEKTES